jgi:ribose 5-phosphate isomerase B
MKIAVAADHAGFELKNHLRDFIQKVGHTVTDLGAHNTEPSDYPDFAEAIGKAVQSGAAERGVLICGSGVGASIAANKLHGIRAAICHDTYSAHQGVEHDKMNILVLGSRIIASALAEDLVKAFLNANFTNEARHLRRLEKVNRLESENK